MRRLSDPNFFMAFALLGFSVSFAAFLFFDTLTRSGFYVGQWSVIGTMSSAVIVFRLSRYTYMDSVLDWLGRLSKLLLYLVVTVLAAGAVADKFLSRVTDGFNYLD